MHDVEADLIWVFVEFPVGEPFLIFSTYAFDLCFMLTRLPNINSGLVDVIIELFTQPKRKSNKIQKYNFQLSEVPLLSLLKHQIFANVWNIKLQLARLKPSALMSHISELARRLGRGSDKSGEIHANWEQEKIFGIEEK